MGLAIIIPNQTIVLPYYDTRRVLTIRFTRYARPLEAPKHHSFSITNPYRVSRVCSGNKSWKAASTP